MDAVADAGHVSLDQSVSFRNSFYSSRCIFNHAGKDFMGYQDGGYDVVSHSEAQFSSKYSASVEKEVS